MKSIFSSALASLIIIFSSFTSYASVVEISGRLADKKSAEPMGFANVTVFKSNKEILAGTVTAENGEFKLSAELSGGEYLQVSFIGYKDLRIELAPEGQKTKLNLGLIELEPESQSLEAAVVTAKVPLVEQKLDKIVVNVSQSVVASTSNAFELLKKSPGVSVDVNGNIQLNGQGVEIWIDGRPSKLSGSQLESLLTALNGNTIEKIEIMQHPSAKFDASGNGGIINIKTKKNFIKGLYGNVNLSYSAVPKADSYDNLQGSFLINYRARRSNTQLSYSTHNIGTAVDFDSVNEFGPDLSLKQTSLSELRGYRRGHFAKIGSDFYPDKKNTFGFLVNYYTSRNTQYTPEGSLATLYSGDNVISKIETHLDEPSSMDRIDANIYYIKNFSGVKELTLNADYGYYDSRDNGYQRSLTESAGIPAQKSAFTNNNSQYINIFSFKGDYKCSPFKKAILESGAKIATTWTNNNSVRRDSTDGAFVITPSQSNLFKYTETIGAAYASLSYQINKRWSIVTGLRGEYTKANGDWISAGEKSSRDYFGLFPTIYLGYTPKNWRLSLSYTRRIERPSFYQLNPFKNYIDATSSVTGNPNLSPSYTNSIALTAGYKSFLNISAIYSQTTDLVTQLPFFDQQTGDKIFLWDNYGKMTIAGAVLSITEYPLVKDLFYLSLNSIICSMSNRSNVDEAGNLQKSNSLFMNHYATLTTLLPHNWKMELVGFYMSGAQSGYMKVQNMGNLYLGIKKELLQKKLTLSLAVNDLLNTSNMDIITETLTNRYTLNQRMYQQKIEFGIKFNFGKVQSGRQNYKRENTSERVNSSSGGGISTGGLGGMN